MVETSRELRARLSIVKKEYDELREQYNDLIRKGKEGTRWAKTFKSDEIKELKKRLKEKREEFYKVAQQYEYAKIGEQTYARSEQEKFINYLSMLLQRGVINQKLYDNIKRIINELSTEDAKKLIALLLKMLMQIENAVKEGLITKDVSAVILNLLAEKKTTGTAREMLRMIDRLRSAIQRGLFTRESDTFKELQDYLKKADIESFNESLKELEEQTTSEKLGFIKHLDMLLQRGVINQKLYDKIEKRINESSTEDAKKLIALLFKLIKDLGSSVKEGLITKKVSGIILNLIGEGETGTAREMLRMIDRLRSAIQRGLFTRESDTFKELQEYLEKIKIKEFNNRLNELNLEALRKEPEKTLKPAAPEESEEGFKQRVLNVAVTYNNMNIITDKELEKIKKLVEEDEADKAQGILNNAYQQYLKQKKEGRSAAPAEAVIAAATPQERVTPTTTKAETITASNKDLKAVLSVESKNKLLKALREKGLA